MIFEESLIVTLPHRRERRLSSYLVGTVVVYACVIGALLVSSILLVHPQLNETLASSVLISPPPPPPPPPPAASAPQSVSRPASVPIIATSFTPPTVTPRRLPDAGELPSSGNDTGTGVPGGVSGGVPGGVIGGALGGVIGGVLGSTPSVAAPPPPPQKQEAPPQAATPQKVSTGILLGNTIRQVPAAYPMIARNAQIQGVVEVGIVVDEQGNVIAAEAQGGHPLLRQSAIEAARQWKFRPTLLNGQPIKVSGVLKFTFRLT